MSEIRTVDVFKVFELRKRSFGTFLGVSIREWMQLLGGKHVNSNETARFRIC